MPDLHHDIEVLRMTMKLSKLSASDGSLQILIADIILEIYDRLMKRNLL